MSLLLTDISDFRVGQKYRFYLDKDHPESEAYIILNLVTEDGGFNGGFTEPGTTGEVDLPNIKIGISNAYDGPGYIYWGDKRLSVDAEVSGDGEYLEYEKILRGQIGALVFVLVLIIISFIEVLIIYPLYNAQNRF